MSIRVEPEVLERLGAIFREGLQLIKEIQRNHEVEEKVQQALRQQQRASELPIASSPVLSRTTPTIALGAPVGFLSSRPSNSIVQESSPQPSVYLAAQSTLSPRQGGASTSSSATLVGPPLPPVPAPVASLMSRPLNRTGKSHKRGPADGGEEQAKRPKTAPSGDLQGHQRQKEEAAPSEVSPNSSSASTSRPQPPPPTINFVNYVANSEEQRSREAILRAFAEYLQRLEYPKPRIGKYLRFVSKIVFEREEITEADIRSGARSAVDAYERFRGAASASPSSHSLEVLSNHSDTSPEMGSP